MQNRRRLVNLIPETGPWHFILETVNCMSIKNIMTHMGKQWLPRDKIYSREFEDTSQQVGTFFLSLLQLRYQFLSSMVFHHNNDKEKYFSANNPCLKRTQTHGWKLFAMAYL